MSEGKAEPESHKLAYPYSMWYLNKKSSGKPTSYIPKKLATFDTVEGFWEYYSHMVRPNELPPSVDYHCFKDGIVPLWEDEANIDGGKWVVRLKKGMASRCWENALLGMIGDHFELRDELCGIVMSTKFAEDILCFWNKTANDRSVTLKLRDAIKKILDIPTNSALEYKAHNTSIKHTIAHEDRQSRASLSLRTDDP